MYINIYMHIYYIYMHMIVVKKKNILKIIRSDASFNYLCKTLFTIYFYTVQYKSQ